MALVLFDSNIIIDYLNGIGEARDELTYWDEPAISVVSWMEVRANIKPDEEDRFELLFSDGDFEIIRIDDAIMTAAARIRTEGIRKGPKIALMDAIIKATAQVYNLTVITRNTKDFKGPNVRVPYEIETLTLTRIVNVRSPEPPASAASDRKKTSSRKRPS